MNKSTNFITENNLKNITSVVLDLIVKNARLHAEIEAIKSKNHETTRHMLLDFLGVADSFEVIFKFIEENTDQQEAAKKGLIKSFMTISKKFIKLLAKYGVNKFDSLGKIADPHIHNIQATKPTDTGTDGEIIEVTKEGYTYNGELLRDADVVVFHKTEGDQ